MSGVELQQKIEAAIRESLERTVGSLRDEVSRRLRHSQEEVLGYLTTVDIRAAVPTLPPELLSPPAPPAPDTSNETLAALEAGFRAIDGSRSQAAVLRSLLVGSSRHATRAAIFLMTKDGARLWESHGFSRAPLPASLKASEVEGLDAIRSGGGAMALDAAGCRQLATRLGVDPASTGVLIPLVLRDQVAAALYADRLQSEVAIDVSALQMLAYVAALSIETLGFRRRDNTPTLTPVGQSSGTHLEPWSGSAAAGSMIAAAVPAPPPAPAPAPPATPAPPAAIVSPPREELRVEPAISAAPVPAVKPAMPAPAPAPAPEVPAFEASLLWAQDTTPKATPPPESAAKLTPPAPASSFTAADWWTRFPEANKEPEPTPAKSLGPLSPTAPAKPVEPIAPPSPSLPSLPPPEALRAPSPLIEPPFPVPPSKPTPVFEAPSFDESLPSLGESFGTVRIPRASDLFANVREAKPAAPKEEASPAWSASVDTARIASPVPEPPSPATAAIPQEALSVPTWEEDVPAAPPAAPTPPTPLIAEPGSGRRVDLSTANLDVSEDETVLLPGRTKPSTAVPTPTVPLTTPIATPIAPIAAHASVAPPPVVHRPAPTTPIPAATEPPVSAATQRIPTAGVSALKPPSGGSTAELPRPRSSSSEVVPPENVRGPGLAFAGARAGETPANEEARRLARLLVSEIKLYNEEQVDLGRKNLDLYQRLREDIDRSRQMYEERVDPTVRSSADYFQQELIRILAAGDPKALGT